MPLGHYEYDKRQPGGSVIRCHVEVFALEVMVQHPSWPEQGMRDCRWMPAREAATAVAEPELAAIIRNLKDGN